MVYSLLPPFVSFHVASNGFLRISQRRTAKQLPPLRNRTESAASCSFRSTLTASSSFSPSSFSSPSLPFSTSSHIQSRHLFPPSILRVAQSAMDVTGSDVPSVADLLLLLPPRDASAEAYLPHTTERLFGTTEEPRILFFRDNSSWCPYCERVWLQLEEKKIPYRVEKINMRCYGPKPDWFMKMVPSGLLPVLQVNGRVITESMDIMLLLEREFPNHRPLLPPRSSPKLREVEELLRLERQVAGAWLQWSRSSWGGQREFEEAISKVNASLSKGGGPFFLGAEFSMVDAVFAPFLERIAASVPYWKGLPVRGAEQWPALNAWFDAMEAMPTYRAMKSDDFTIAHTLEPQIGPAAFAKAGESYRKLVDGKGGSWDLPLAPEETAWGKDDGTGSGGAKEAAARSLVENHDAVVRFAMRGVKGAGEEVDGAVSEGFRLVAHALLVGVERAGPPSSLRLPQEVAVAAAYLRDRVGVPRDLPYPAARQLRAHLQWLVRGLGSSL